MQSKSITTPESQASEIVELKEKVAHLERQIELQPLNDRIKELDILLNEPG